MTTPIVLPPLGSPVDELWEVLLELSKTATVPWTLIGGQMVLLHALEHGTVPPQVSQDGDVIADVRAEPGSLKGLVASLVEMGFESVGMAPDGVAHRYRRDSNDPKKPVLIDVLAPEGVGERADLTTTPPGRTIQVPGGTQALSRTEQVPVQVRRRTGTVPRPTLLAAVVSKAAACGLPEDVSRHLRDLALLCALIDDPFAAGGQLSAGDRRRLKCAEALNDADHEAWRLVPPDRREQGRVAWEILNDARHAAAPSGPEQDAQDPARTPKHGHSRSSAVNPGNPEKSS